MSLDLALVPVLAGYWVLVRTHLFKYAYEPKTHHRVFFEPAITGLLLLAIAWLLVRTVEPTFAPAGSLSCVGDLWRRVEAPPRIPLFATIGFLALLTPPIINARVSKEDALNRWAQRNETAKGRLLRVALEQGQLIEVVLANGRAFVGFVTTSPDVAGFEGDLALAPQLSGHRDPVTHRLSLTAHYDDAGDDFRLVLLLDELTAISHFDPDSPFVDWNIP